MNQNYEGDRTAYGYPYHGYWIADITQLNDRFGTEDDLKALIADLHARDMYLMVDVVVNNVVSVNYTFLETRLHVVNRWLPPPPPTTQVTCSKTPRTTIRTAQLIGATLRPSNIAGSVTRRSHCLILIPLTPQWFQDIPTGSRSLFKNMILMGFESMPRSTSIWTSGRNFAVVQVKDASFIHHVIKRSYVFFLHGRCILHGRSVRWH